MIVKNSDSYINGLTVGKGKNSNALNTVIGLSAGASLSTGNVNTFVGNQSGLLVTSGESNSFFGYLSGNNNQTGSWNVAIGVQSLAGGSHNLYATCIGYRSGHNNNNGSSTTSIGSQSGFYNNGGDFNTYLGCNTDLINYGAIVFGYSTAIGYNAKIDASNTIVMGTSTETTKIPGKLNVLLDASFNSNVDISGNLSVKKGSVKYSTTYSTSGSTLTNNSTYSHTFNGSSLICNLPSVDSANVGIQFLITNVNSNSLSVTTSSQFIYSSGSSATLRTLLQYESQIFTAIQTNTTTYGWSMV